MTVRVAVISRNALTSIHFTKCHINAAHYTHRRRQLFLNRILCTLKLTNQSWQNISQLKFKVTFSHSSNEKKDKQLESFLTSISLSNSNALPLLLIVDVPEDKDFCFCCWLWWAASWCWSSFAVSLSSVNWNKKGKNKLLDMTWQLGQQTHILN